MTRPIDNTDADVANRIVAIQRAAYAVEAQLMGFDGIPPLHESIDDIVSREDLTWWGAFAGETLVAVIGWADLGDVIEIDRLAVDPAFSRQGYGRTLVQAVPSPQTIEVSTGSANHPARALYESEGFEQTGTTEVAPDIFTTQFRRRATTPGSTPEHSGSPTESDAERIAVEVFSEAVRSCTRFTTGLRHWVYDVTLDHGRDVVVRIAQPDNRAELGGGVYWHGHLRSVGIQVPDILAHDVAAPQPYMILERLAGTDLGNVFDDLSDRELANTAATVMDMQRRVSDLPQANGFGYALSYNSPLQTRWQDVLESSVQRSASRIDAAGVVDSSWVGRVRSRLGDATDSFADIEPAPFLHDATTKNVIVSNGIVTGLVDTDEMAFGDPLWAIALTRMSLLAARRPLNYIDLLVEGMQTPPPDARLDLYTAIFCLDFLAELGQQFNNVAPPPIDSAFQRHMEATLETLL